MTAKVAMDNKADRSALISWWLPTLLLTLFHVPGLFGGHVRVDPAYAWSLAQPDAAPLKAFNQDMVQGAYPYWSFAHWVRETGASWEWNPFMFGGVPLWPEGSYPLAGLMAQIAHLFGPELGFSVLPFVTGLAVIALGNLILRTLGLPVWARTVSVVLLVLTYDMLVWLQTPHAEVNLWLLVGVLVGLRIWQASITAEKAAWALGGGALVGLMHLGSHVQFTLLTAIPFLAVFMLACAVLRPDGRLRWPDGRTLLAGAAFCLAAAAVGAWAWLPTLEVAFDSYRSVTPKGSNMPVYVRFMPLPFPRYEDLTLGLQAWFSFDSLGSYINQIFPLRQIPVIGFNLDGHYLSLTAYMLCVLAVVEPKTRRQAAPLLLSFALIFFGYNALALAAKVPQIAALLNAIPLLDAINLPGVVIRANVFLWLGAGFGLVAVGRLASDRRWRWARWAWAGVLVVAASIAIYASWAMRRLLESDLQAFLSAGKAGVPEHIPPLVAAQVDRLIARWDPMPWELAAALGLLAIEFALVLGLRAYPRRRAVMAGVMGVSLAVTGYVSYHNKLDWTLADSLVPDVPAIDTIRQQTEPGRVVAVNRPVDKQERIRNYLETVDTVEDLGAGPVVRISREVPFVGGMSLLYRVEDIRGVSALNGRAYRIFVEAVQAQPPGTDPTIPQMLSEFYYDLPLHARSYDLLNVRWVLSAAELSVPQYVKRQDGPMNLYENVGAQPRAWLASAVEVIPERRALLRRLTDLTFTPDTVLLEVDPRTSTAPSDETRYGLRPEAPLRVGHNVYEWRLAPNPVASRLYGSLPFADTAPARWDIGAGPLPVPTVTMPDLNQRVIEVTTPEPAMLVISEPFYFGWEARLNGNPVDIYRANFALMAIPISAGHNRVELTYQSRTRSLGLSVSIVVFGLLLGGTGLCILSARKTRAAAAGGAS
ncbi:YfhO family protein [Rhodospira trueperi]|uniref:Membrane protein YfhO n=1 Tax=Rhodospira trueperi TaxID=69960 RepID=A0A1G7GNZ6_9PROT|nr:YfhO family protein [Rhodospira trueperi]SDE89860.1 membrane protein YfhO [Rhodospira trueperi]